jgi:metallo-beta-lactamase class B
MALASACGIAASLLCVAQAQDRATNLNHSQPPFRIFGHSYYVGTRDVSAVLIASPSGAVLIDGALAESAPQITDNIIALGVRLDAVKLIVNSNVHSDHAGGIAELQRRTGATVAASSWSARVLRTGRKDPGDPQFATATPPPPRVPSVRTIRDGEVLQAGDVTVTAHMTGGHTPGGTSWTWRTCEDRCLDLVYADSLTSVSADGFRFSDSSAYRQGVSDFARSFAFLRTVSCDILLTTHPEASDFWGRVARRTAGADDALLDRSQCARLADRADMQLQRRLASEHGR